MADATRLWLLLRTHAHRLLLIIAGIALFMAGWQVGRVMSPYYAAHPIVFEEGNVPVSRRGAPQELVALREQGTETAAPTAATAPAPTVAAAQTGLFVGSVNSDKYHHYTCPSAKRILPANQRWFASPAEAEQAGYVPSECTKEKLKQ